MTLQIAAISHSRTKQKINAILSIYVKIKLFALIISLLHIIPANAKTIDLVIERAYIHDTEGSYTIDDVIRMKPTPFEGVLSLGYGGPVWLKISLPKDATIKQEESSTRLYLRGRPSYLDDILLFDPDITQTPRPPLGDRHPIANQDLPAAVFIWEIPRTAHARDLWLRVETTSTRLMHFEVLSESDLFLSNARIIQIGAIYIGILTVFCIWALVQLLFRPDGLIAAFLFCQVFSLGFGIGLLGYSRIWISDWAAAEWAD
jgi:hypothetical protein